MSSRPMLFFLIESGFDCEGGSIEEAFAVSVDTGGLVLTEGNGLVNAVVETEVIGSVNIVVDTEGIGSVNAVAGTAGRDIEMEDPITGELDSSLLRTS